MIIQNNYAEVTRSSSSLETNQASIEMTPMMFKLLSSGLYQFKERAVIRELSCNGLDGHEMNGNPEKPLDIHLPTRFEPYFEVRDYGIGMTHEEIMNLYLCYGASTKRDNNYTIGGFGVGSKSFFSIAQSATVTSWKDGIKRQYTIYMEEGMPQVTKLMETESDEPTGISVRVAVPMQMGANFFHEACYVYSFFDVKPNVNMELDYFHDNYDLVVEGEGYKAYTHSRMSKSIEPDVKVVMGQVAYDLDIDTIFKDRSELWELIDESLFKEFSLVELHLPIGTVEVAASRETLSMEESTHGYIVNIFKDFASSVVKDIQKNVDKCDSYMAVASLRQELLHSYKNTTVYYLDKHLTYKGKTLAEWITHFAYRYAVFRLNKLGQRFPMRDYRGVEVTDNYGNTIYAHDVKDLGIRRYSAQELREKKPIADVVNRKTELTPFSFWWSEEGFKKNIFVVNDRRTKKGTIKTTGNLKILKALSDSYAEATKYNDVFTWVFPSVKDIYKFIKGLGIDFNLVKDRIYLLSQHEDLYEPVRREVKPVKIGVISESIYIDKEMCVEDVEGSQLYVKAIGNDVESCGIQLVNGSVEALARILGRKIYVFKKANWKKIPDHWVELTDEMIKENLYKDSYQMFRLNMYLTKTKVSRKMPSYSSLDGILSWRGSYVYDYLYRSDSDWYVQLEDVKDVIEKYVGKFHYVALSDRCFTDYHSDIYTVVNNVLTSSHIAKAKYTAIRGKLYKKIEKDLAKFKERNFLYSLIDWDKVRFKELALKDGGVEFPPISDELNSKMSRY